MEITKTLPEWEWLTSKGQDNNDSLEKSNLTRPTPRVNTLTARPCPTLPALENIRAMGELSSTSLTGGTTRTRDETSWSPFGAYRPAFKIEAARLASFTNWPGRMHQRPDELADAGFYYTGQGDRTVCFCCGGGLKDWEDEDRAWEQHAMWFERCPYLLAVKGEHYVFEVQQRLSRFESSPLPKPESKPAPTVVTQMNDRSDDDSKLCGICCEGERNICIMPCGHVFTCAKCTMSIDDCPVCRGPINNFQRLYYS